MMGVGSWELGAERWELRAAQVGYDFLPLLLFRRAIDKIGQAEAHIAGDMIMAALRTRRSRKAPALKENQEPFFSKHNQKRQEHEGGAISSGDRHFFKPSVFKPSVLPSAQSVQTKLTIGKPNDAFEREADATANSVVKQIASHQGAINQDANVTPTSSSGSDIQAKEKMALQRQANEEEMAQTKPEIMKMEEEETAQTKPDIMAMEEEEAAQTKPEVMKMEEEEAAQTKPDIMAMEEEEAAQTKPEVMKMEEEEAAQTKPDIMAMEEEEAAQT
ncbi:MAG: hypothetical protein F6K09_05355, partial [Merismopedia sp. SIO2A8]|nr:hypothetical protein [Merismopedia sp. SIO2A8]